MDAYNTNESIKSCIESVEGVLHRKCAQLRDIIFTNEDYDTELIMNITRDIKLTSEIIITKISELNKLEARLENIASKSADIVLELETALADNLDVYYNINVANRCDRFVVSISDQLISCMFEVIPDKDAYRVYMLDDESDYEPCTVSSIKDAAKLIAYEVNSLYE